MITEKYIMKRLREFAASDAGKALIKEKTGKTYVPSFDKSTINEYGKEMKEILYTHIHPIINTIKMEDIIVGEPIKDSEGNVSIKLSFKEGSLHRQSLDPDCSGIDNIVLLFAHGYQARNKVRGVWADSHEKGEIWSLQQRAGNDFMESAVDEFNGKAKGVCVAVLEDKYKSGASSN